MSPFRISDRSIKRLRCYALPVRVLVNFQHRKGWNIHTMAEDCRTRLGPYRDVASEQTLIRLFAYLGATPTALEEAANDLRRWSRGGFTLMCRRVGCTRWV